MGTIEIKGVRIGEGRPKAIVSLMDAELPGLLASARATVEAGADCLEWRADLFAQVEDMAEVAEACRCLAEALPATPLVVTLRTKGQGGRLAPTPATYRTFCEAAIATGAPDLIDLELGLGDEAVRALVRAAHERGVRAIVSYHDFDGTPEVAQMERLLLHMAELGADIPKLAVMAHEEADAVALMEATRRVKAQVDMPLLTMAMGEAGQRTRLCGESFGSALTFCARGHASAPGQVELAEALRHMTMLHHLIEVFGPGMPSLSIEDGSLWTDVACQEKGDPMQLNGMIDHTNLKQDARRADIERLCDEAIRYGFATVCVNSCWVPLASVRLAGTGVGVTTVVGFPLGAASTEAKAAETARAVADGATEIDMVLNVGRCKDGDDAFCTADIAAVVAAAGEATVKVILECCLLTDDEIVHACHDAVAAGADYVKTSTGFSTGGATVHDVALMRATVGDACKVKAAGGMHTRAEAEAMVAAGADRLGTSASIAIVEG